MIMIDVTEYKKILSQRDDTIVKQADTIAVLRAENIVLRDRCAEKISADLVVDSSKLRAELARVKPPWSSAPEWAEMRYVISHWTGRWREAASSCSQIRGVRTMEICKDVESRPK